MKSSLKAFAALLVFAVAVPSVQAQGGPPQNGMRQGGGRMMEMLLKDITLDATQKAKIDSIAAKHSAMMPPMERGVRPDSSTMATRREHMMKQQEEIREVLTTDQQKVFDKNVAEMRERMQRRGRQGGRGSH